MTGGNAVALVAMVACMTACEPSVTFTEPQPTGTDDLAMFPDRLQGEYLSLADSSILSIGDKLIQRIYAFDDTIAPDQLDSSDRLQGDTLINLKTNERTMVRREGDSLVVHVQYVDTLFRMNYDNVVRKMKGYYFLNTRHGQVGWEVEKLHLSKVRLMVGKISMKQDLDTLKAITENPADTVPPYRITATKRQFRKFVRAEGFSDSETFVRQR